VNTFETEEIKHLYPGFRLNTVYVQRMYIW